MLKRQIGISLFRGSFQREGNSNHRRLAAFTYLLYGLAFRSTVPCLGKSVLGTLYFQLVGVSGSRSNATSPIPAFFCADTASDSRG